MAQRAIAWLGNGWLRPIAGSVNRALPCCAGKSSRQRADAASELGPEDALALGLLAIAPALPAPKPIQRQRT